MPILKVVNLTKQFGSFTAVNNISFELKEAEILGILGPNGAGKTTTIQMLLGIMTPTSGQIRYFGKNLLSSRQEILEKVNFSSTYTNLPWDLTVWENLHFISYLYEITDRKKRLNKIIEQFRLGPLLKQRMKDLSAGQLTRVNLAKAFINYPKILLLDEPTASLDPQVSEMVRLRLLEDRKVFKTSIIITSHNMGEVEEICDRVIFINKGTVIDDDTPYNLAKKINTSHVRFMVKESMEALEKFLAKNNINFQIEGNYLTADIRENDIGSYLQEIVKIGVVYDEIYILRPTLEDYFLERARNS